MTDHQYQWVVVLLGGTCDEAPDSLCVQNVYGPFASKTEAHEFGSRCSGWMIPHYMRLERPEELV